MVIDHKTEDRFSVDSGHQRFSATLVGLLVGQVIGSYNVTIAKAVLQFSGHCLTRERVGDMSVIVIFILACGGFCFGAFAAKRSWVRFEPVLISIFMAIFVAFLSIVDHSMPVVRGEGKLQLARNVYYFGWIFFLWLLPFFLLPRTDGNIHRLIQRGGGLLIASVALCLSGFGVGVVVEGIAKLLDEFCVNLFEDSQAFWIARPTAINAIGCAYAMVAFSGFWWHSLWRSDIRSYVWSASTVTFATIYTGIYGGLFFAKVHCADWWQTFLAFAALPAAIALTVLAAYGLTRQDRKDVAIGWPVSKWFWRLLPTGLAVTLALIAYFGLAPLGDKREQVMLVVVAHGINGVFLGVTFQLMPCIFKLIPDGRPKVFPGEIRGRC